MNQIYFDEPQTPTWADVFPWMGPLPWRNDPASDTNSEALGSIVSSAVRSHRTRTIAELFSSLHDEVQLQRLDLSEKAERNLRAHDIYTGREIKPLTISEISDWRGFGEGALTKFLTQIATATVRHALEGDRVWNPGDAVPEPVAQHRPAEEIAQALEDLAKWFIAIGAPDVPMLSTEGQSMGTERTTDIHDDFLSLTALDVLTPEKQQSPIASVFSGIIEGLEERQLQILDQRVFSREPRTLDDIGQDFDLTRERVRQLEKQAKEHIGQALDESEIMQELLALIARKVQEIRPLEDLLLSYPALRENIHGTDKPLWFVLSQLDRDYTRFDYVIEDGWILPRGKKISIERTKEALQAEANEYGVLPIDQVDIVATQNVNADEANLSWLKYCKLMVDDTYVYLKAGKHGDRVAAILSISGTPLATEAIESKLPNKGNFRSVLNAIQADERITRVDRDVYALAEWGMPAYVGIKTSIQNYLEDHDGEAPIGEMVKDLTSKFDISPSSVRSYAAALPFKVDDGIVSFAEPGTRSKKRPQDTARLFRTEHGWKYRITVNADHLRGSGFGVPMSFATMLDMQFGDRREFAHPLGHQTVSWNSNIVATGSIRRILQDQNIPEGAEIFLYFGDDNTFEIIEAQKQPQNFLAEPMQEVARLIDAREAESFDDIYATLCRAVGAAPTIMPFPLASLLRAKGDTDIAKALGIAVDNAKRSPR
ncbi:sigma factor-like helix-turn-helix DNA-binding protein [Corynebacterium sp. S7]